MKYTGPSRDRRRCRWCPVVTRSLRRTRLHEIDAHPDKISPEDRLLAPPPNRKALADAALRVIMMRTKAVIRGATEAELAAELRRHPKVVRLAMRVLLERGYVAADGAGGYTATPSGTRAILEAGAGKAPERKL